VAPTHPGQFAGVRVPPLANDGLMVLERSACKTGLTKFEFAARDFGADETLDSQAFDQIDGGITLHSVAVFRCTGRRHSAVRGDGNHCIQQLGRFE
jgi:hypothetical protein